MILEELPKAQIELNIEITWHPELQACMLEVLAQNGGKYDFSLMLATVAAYCEVIVDDYYIPEEINNLCAVLTNKLREKRQTLLIPIGSPIQTIQ